MISEILDETDKLKVFWLQIFIMQLLIIGLNLSFYLLLPQYGRKEYTTLNIALFSIIFIFAVLAMARQMALGKIIGNHMEDLERDGGELGEGYRAILASARRTLSAIMICNISIWTWVLPFVGWILKMRFLKLMDGLTEAKYGKKREFVELFVEKACEKYRLGSRARW